MLSGRGDKREKLNSIFKWFETRIEAFTPEATLYAAMLREIKAKGAEARFVKSERGLFSAAGR